MACQPTIQIGLVLAVTLHTKSHLEAKIREPILLLDLAVALFTGEPFADMPLMVEKHMLGYIKDLTPGRRGLGIEIVVLFSNLRVIGDNILMAKETLFHRRQAGEGGAHHIRVAKTAVNGLDTRMQPVAERDRLFWTDLGRR